jgi:hypothetical protein
MTPLELENSFQLYKDIINTTESTYTNILEKHIVEHVVDIQKNIDYFYSDSIDKKNKKKINRKYKGVYSTKFFDSNFRDFFDDEEENEEKEEDEKEEIIKNIIPFINKKKNVGEGKIIKDKSFSIISPKDNYNNKEEINNNICIDTCDFNSNNQQQSEKQKNQQNMPDLNYKLIYYCYTNLKRKRPLIIQKDDNEGICGLEIEEYFNQIIMRSSTFKKNKDNNQLQINNKLRSKSTKNLNRKKVKKNKFLKNINKKNSKECATNRNKNNNNHSNNLASELKNLKSKIKKLKSIKSEKKSKIKKERLSQDNKFEKLRINSLAKKHRKILSNDTKIKVYRESFQNIITKKDTKRTFYNENSPSTENKKKNNSKRKEQKANSKNKELKSNSKNKEKSSSKNKEKSSSKNKEIKSSSKNKEIKSSSKNKEIKSNSKNKEKIKDSKKNGKSKFKFIANSKLKRQFLEEIKVGNKKPNKKSLKEPIRAKFMNSLQKKVGFYFEENKKNFYKNENSSSKTPLLSKKKSKSKKDCTAYDDNSDDDDDEQYFKKRKLSYGLKDKNINSVHSKKNNSINKKRKFS